MRKSAPATRRVPPVTGAARTACGTWWSCPRRSAQQPEQLAALDFEAHMIDGREGAEHANEIAHLRSTASPRAVASGAGRASSSDQTRSRCESACPQQRHEAVFEARRRGRDRRSPPASARGNRARSVRLGTNEADAPGLGHRIDDFRTVQQPRLQARAAAARAADRREIPGRPRACSPVSGGPWARIFPSMHDDVMPATFGFVEIGRADENGACSVPHEPEDDLPQFLPRQRVDAGCRLVEQQQFAASGRARRQGRASASCRRKAGRPGAAERASAVISISRRIARSRRSAAATPWRSA